jgi:nicotinamidase-related amidase
MRAVAGAVATGAVTGTAAAQTPSPYAGPLNMAGFEGPGADFVGIDKPCILDGKTPIATPRQIDGPGRNDVGLQLRQQRVVQVILAGMSSNLRVESHLRELMEQGFEVAVVGDATAGAKVPEGDGDLSALICFRMVANAVWTTADAVERVLRLRA